MAEGCTSNTRWCHAAPTTGAAPEPVQPVTASVAITFFVPPVLTVTASPDPVGETLENATLPCGKTALGSLLLSCAVPS